MGNPQPGEHYLVELQSALIIVKVIGFTHRDRRLGNVYDTEIVEVLNGRDNSTISAGFERRMPGSQLKTKLAFVLQFQRIRQLQRYMAAHLRLGRRMYFLRNTRSGSYIVTVIPREIKWDLARSLYPTYNCEIVEVSPPERKSFKAGENKELSYFELSWQKPELPVS